jgi:hypothetical protein
VRTDLPLAQQLIQTAHAAQESGLKFPGPRPEPDYICLLSVPDEPSLMAMAERLKAADIALCLVREPDLDNQFTAIATEPLSGGCRKVLRGATMWTAPTTNGSSSPSEHRTSRAEVAGSVPASRATVTCGGSA